MVTLWVMALCWGATGSWCPSLYFLPRRHWSLLLPSAWAFPSGGKDSMIPPSLPLFRGILPTVPSPHGAPVRWPKLIHAALGEPKTSTTIKLNDGSLVCCGTLLCGLQWGTATLGTCLDPHLTSTSQLLGIHSLKSQPEAGLEGEVNPWAIPGMFFGAERYRAQVPFRTVEQTYRCSSGLRGTPELLASLSVPGPVHT